MSTVPDSEGLFVVWTIAKCVAAVFLDVKTKTPSQVIIVFINFSQLELPL